MKTEFSTLIELLQARALHQPSQRAYTFLVDGGSEEVHLTYEELDLQARNIAVLLHSVASEGERALLLYPPGLEFISAFFGCIYAQIAALPTYPPHPARWKATVPRIRAIAAQARVSVVLTTTAIQSAAEPLRQQWPELSAISWLATDELDANLAGAWHAPAVTRDTLAFVQYTSGSTALPKGVMITHENLLHNSALIHRAFGHSPKSRGVIWLPPYHDMGLIGGVLQPLYGGFPVTLMSPASFLMRPIRWLEAISRTRATTSGGPNFAYDLCVRKTTPEQRASLDLRSWDVAFNGAEPVRHDTLERFAAAFEPSGFRRETLYPCYGLAEATLFVAGGLKLTPPKVARVRAAALERNEVVEASVNPSNAEAGIRSLIGCGHAWADQTICIVDPEMRTRCPAGRVGEIWVAGPSVARAYLHCPDETEHSFGAYLADSGEGPFLRTGDLGFFRDDELFITGRLKDLIIIGGRNHYAEDIEQTVERSHRSVRSGGCAAFSVDGDGQERLIILAELERSYSKSGPPFKAENLIQKIREVVSENHDLRVHEVLLLKPASFPKTSSGKVQRHRCRAGFLAGTLDRLRTDIGVRNEDAR